MKSLIPLLALACLLSACSDTEEFSTSKTGLIETRAPSLSVTTTSASVITSLSATSGGTIGNQGGGNSTSERGVVYSTTPSPDIDDPKITAGSGAGIFECVIPANPATTYYVRAYAIKRSSITYGNEISFTTLAGSDPVTDIDGNVYNTVNINGKIWMTENLKTTRYNDGTPIPNVTDNAAWANLRGANDGAYCNYDNNPAHVDTYGRLYNWHAVNSPHQLAPTGWHIPSKAEWDALEAWLATSAAGKMKEAGTTHWTAPNTGGTNATMLTILPAGVRDFTGVFSEINNQTCVWSSSLAVGWAYYRHLKYNSALCDWGISGNDLEVYKSKGLSVRCVKN